MCGFAFLRYGKAVPGNIASRIAKAKAELSRRGPDSQNINSLPGATLLHHRLSIVGGDSGVQPIWSGDKKCALLFNGEIYNYKDIRQKIYRSGIEISAKCSDSEVLLHAYLLWGEEIFNTLDGMFACVFYHPEEDRIVIACDRYGIKPLYYSEYEGEIAFASTLGANVAIAGLPNKKPSRIAVDQLLRVGFNFGGITFHPDVNQLQPGRYRVYEKGSLVTDTAFWTVDYAMNALYTNNDNQGCETLLQHALSSQWCEEQPSGIFLSSGMDSSLINVGYRQKNIQRYTASFQGDEDDEWVRLSSSGILTERVLCNEKNLLNTKLILQLYDSPFSDNAALPTYLLAKRAKSNVKVVYSGDGADELFMGYRNHRLLRLENFIHKSVPGLLKPATVKFSKSGIASTLKMRSTLETLQRTWAQSYTCAISHLSREQLDSLYLPCHDISVTSDSMIEDYENSLTVQCPMKRAQALDWLVYLPGSVLTKVDRATMANSPCRRSLPESAASRSASRCRARAKEARLPRWPRGAPDRSPPLDQAGTR